MSGERSRRTARGSMLSALLLAAAFGPAPAPAQETLQDLLRANRQVMTVGEDGRLNGAGADLLLAAGREAQFFLIGEEHGVAEIPLVAGALFLELVPYGYRHLAIETGDGLAEALNRALVEDPEGGAYRAFLERHWPGAPFYSWRQDAELLRTAVAAAGNRGDVLWGLDYDVMADRFALQRLRDLAPGGAARDAVEAAISEADTAFSRALAEKNPGLLFMFGGPEAVYGELRAAIAPEPGSEADRILHLMEETRAINALFMTGRGYESNHRRALLNKARFMSYLTEAAAGGTDLPRVMLKFGASHMVRGRNLVDVFDLGALASELAEAHGGRSFGVMMAGGAGTKRAVIDSTVMRTIEAPVEFAAVEWARPFFEAADPDRWTVFDLRPLRPRIARLEGLHDTTVRLLYGFDAFVVLSGSGPQSGLLER
jgi:hypothetical protein